MQLTKHIIDEASKKLSLQSGADLEIRQPAPEDFKSEDCELESQRRQHFSPMKSLLKCTCILFLWKLYTEHVRGVKCINLLCAHLWQIHLNK